MKNHQNRPVENQEGNARRPLKSRSTAWARWLSARLCAAGISPDAISAASIGIALLGAAAYASAGRGWLPWWAGWCAGAACVQLRLLCNLMDGMVAIEGGKKSPTGGIWNEAPDRIADALFLAGAGIGTGQPWLGSALAWAAVMTAYVRSLGAELTGAHDFCGPGAKPHRMAALTVSSLVLAFIPVAWRHDAAGALLGIILALTIITIFRRLFRLSRELKRP